MSDTQTMEGIKRNSPEGATHYHVGLQFYLVKGTAGYYGRWYRFGHSAAGNNRIQGVMAGASDEWAEAGVASGEIVVLADIPDDMAESLAFQMLEGDEDDVNHPSHYQIGAGIQAIDIIKGAMTPEQYKGYLLGNQIKYRMRAGSKGDAAKCLAKAEWYRDRLNQEFPC